MGEEKKVADHVISSLSFEVEVPKTLHQIGQDSWFQVGLVLKTGVNSAYALGYATTLMVPLGWIGGVTGLVLSTLMSLYASTFMAKIHEYGERRHIRFRDLAGFMYGWRAYVTVRALQFANLFLINIGFIILGGQPLKAFYLLFREDHEKKLPYFIVIAGLACEVFAIVVPHLSALRLWLAVSTVLSIVYFTIAFALSLKDAASLVSVYNTGMIPEI